jgi:hypothetical protein
MNMHLLKYVSIALAVAALVLLAVALGDESRARATSLTAAVICFLTTVTLVAGLLHAQRPICTTLGGQWIAEEDPCRHGFGGNGNNDPGADLTFFD